MEGQAVRKGVADKGRRTVDGMGQRGLRTLAMALAIGSAMALGGCAGRPGPDALAVNATPETGAKPVKILVATTRMRDANPGMLFNGERAEKLDFASVTLSVPPSHKTGQIEWAKQGAGNPATDMVVRDAVYRDTESQFLQELNADLAKRPKGERDVFIFVHGYNTQFSEAVFRLTQMAHDAEATAVPILFTWASRGKTEDYVYDNNSATAARDNLEELIKLVAKSNAERFSILAHSMGNWVTVEALRQMRIDRSLPDPKRIANIVLAAPDIDVDVFKSQLRRFGKPEKPFVVIVSHDDKALKISDLIAGGKQRLGSFKDDKELVSLGAVVVDMTDVKSDGDGLNHGKFAQLAGLRSQLRQTLERTASSGTGSAELEQIRISGITPAMAGSMPGGTTRPATVSATTAATTAGAAIATSGATATPER